MLEAAGNPQAYYWKIQQGFARPSIYFQTPEIDSGGDTVGTYYMDYMWFLVFFHEDTNKAHAMALAVYEAIKKARNLIPLLDQEGAEIDHDVRISDLNLRSVDEGAVQLTVRFRSRRPYDRPDVEKMKWLTVHVDGSDISWTNKPDAEED